MAENDWQAHCLLTTEQMAAADRAAIAAGTPGIALMEAAGAAVAREIRLRWRPRPATILCGPGNNGGDGFTVARLLLDAGWPVAVLHAPLPERLQGDARAAYERWLAAAGTENRPAATSEWRADGLETAELIVDALFGGGLTRPLAGRPADLLERAAARRRDAGAPLIAIDVPSGVDGDTGACLGPVAQANLTVTFFRAKPGHFLLPGREMCGTLAVHDIGIADSALDRIAPRIALNAPALWRQALRPASPGDHKYTRGHVLVLAGAMPGASVLAARAAARSGAGMVTVGWFPEDDANARPACDAQLPASILKQPLADTGDLARFCSDRRVRVLLVGQGFGRTAEKQHKLAEICAISVSSILDAEAISAFVSTMAGASGAMDTEPVLTPHSGEFARIEDSDDGLAEPGSTPEASPESKVTRTLRVAARTGATIAHKGYDTVIAAPDGRAVVNPNGSPALASAGTGDILAGMIAGLRAQGMPPFDAACAAVWCHADAAGRSGRGLVADDLPDRIPEAMAAAFG